MATALKHQRAVRNRIQIRKGDNVKVMAGRDAGKRSEEHTSELQSP